MDIAHINERNRPHSLPLYDLQRELTSLESGSFISLTDSQLQERLRTVHDGYAIEAPIFSIGTGIYRAVRVLQRPAHKSRISYPPVGAANVNGRLNRAGEVMFYGAFHLLSCLQECSWQVGDFYAVSGWLTTQAMTFNHLGYSRAVIEASGSKRNLPFFAQKVPDSDRNTFIREWQARVFTKQVPPGQEHLYRLPIALKDFALAKMRQIDPKCPDVFSGVIYPSVAMKLFSDNIAILPTEVDTKLALFEVILMTLDAIKVLRKDDGGVETNMSMKHYDFARPDTDGNLIWGQKSQIIYPPGTDASKFVPCLLAPE